MEPAEPPSYRALLKPALFTAGISLVAFGLAHTAFISWIPSPMPDSTTPGTLPRFGIMFVAPVMIGIVPSLVAAFVSALAWRLNWGTPLASARYGIVGASALAPAFLANFALRGEEPTGALVALVLASTALLPAAIGWILARSWRGAVAGPAFFPMGAMLTLFFASTPLSGWVLPFAVSVVLILAASGALMARLATGASSYPKPLVAEA